MDEEPLDDLVTPLKEAVDRWNCLGWEHPAVAVVSGSGLAVDLGERIHGPVSPEYFLPFSCHPVEGHAHEVDVLLHIKVLRLTNATGGLDPDHRPGDLVLLSDHINLTGINPLRGQLPAE